MKTKDIQNKGFSMGQDYPPTERRTYQQGFIEGALWMREELQKEVCQWLEREYAYNGSMAVIDYHLIEDLKQAMEEEQ